MRSDSCFFCTHPYILQSNHIGGLAQEQDLLQSGFQADVAWSSNVVGFSKHQGFHPDHFPGLFGERTSFHHNSLERGLGLGCCTYLIYHILSKSWSTFIIFDFITNCHILAGQTVSECTSRTPRFGRHLYGDYQYTRWSSQSIWIWWNFWSQFPGWVEEALIVSFQEGQGVPINRWADDYKSPLLWARAPESNIVWIFALQSKKIWVGYCLIFFAIVQQK